MNDVPPPSDEQVESSGAEKIVSSSPSDPDQQYVVVARRYRPQGFDQLIGQEHVAQALSGAIATNRVGHAYIFTGARGVGKTSAARIFAKALNCVEGPTSTPCNKCDICLGIGSGDDIDVLEIDGASNRGIDEIRSLRHNVGVRPNRSRFKIYIIDEVHMLTREAFNALLKTLEEPPEHVKFIFCTTEPNKIPVTILSRCQRFDFAGIASRSIMSRLRQIVDAEGVEAEDEALQLLAQRAAGSMRDSQSLLEQVLAFSSGKITTERVHSILGTAGGDLMGRMIEGIVARDAATVIGLLDVAVSRGVDPGQLLEQLFGYFRDLMAASCGCSADQFQYAPAADAEKVTQLAKQIGMSTIMAAMQMLDQTLSRMRVSLQSRILAELALVRICNLEELDRISDLIADLRAATLGCPPPERPSPPSAPTVMRNVQQVEENAVPAPAEPTLQEVIAPQTTEIQAPPVEQTETVNPEPPVEESPTAPTETTPESITETAPSETQTDVAAATDSPPAPSSDEPAETSSIADPRRLWLAACHSLTGTAAGFAMDFDRVEMLDANRMMVRLKSTLARNFCEQPDIHKQIRDLVVAVAGRPIQVDFDVVETAPSERRAPMIETQAATRGRRLGELAENPFIKKANELFGAEPADYRDPNEHFPEE